MSKTTRVTQKFYRTIIVALDNVNNIGMRNGLIVPQIKKLSVKS